MSIKSGQTDAQAIDKPFGNMSVRLAATMLLVSASFMLMPTAASAGYNISGLVRLALAHYNGGSRPSGGHQVSRQRDADADDETDTDTPPRKTDVSSVSSVPSRRPDTDRISSRSTEPDRMASGRQYRDDPLDLTH
jgi:hypothetical protein